MASTLTQDRTATERSPGGPNVRKAWRIVGSLVAAVTLVFGGYQLIVQLAHEEYTFERSFDGEDIALIEVRNRANGPIRIVGADTDTISITAHVDDGLRRTGHNERVEGDRLVVDSSCPMIGSAFCAVSYSIEVPRELHVVAVSSSSRVQVTGVDGDIEARTDNGRVELARIGGSIRADSDNGSVVLTELTSDEVQAATDNGRVEARFDEAPQLVDVDSDNGSVEVVLPEDDTQYRVETDTDDGAVSSGVLTDPSSDDNVIRATTDNGDVTIRYG